MTPGAGDGGAPDLDAVRAALCDGDDTLLGRDGIASVTGEGRWLAVVLSLDAPPRELVRAVHARLAARFPGCEIDVRAGASVYRGGAGFGQERHVIAVVGGKGGVGKSTVAVNLALTLAAMGEKVGLLDADINAPDVPHMLGVHIAAPARRVADAAWSAGVAPPSAWAQPERRYGIEVMSVGFAVPERYPPRITSRLLASTLLRKFVFEAAWTAGILVIDAPPGTGEELQVIFGELPLSGAIFVTTPQDLAQMDAERTLVLMAEHGLPAIGVVKNMASMACPHCAQRIDMFASSGRLDAAGVAVLGEVPFDVRLSSAADAGLPLVLADPRGPVAYEFAKIAAVTRRWLRTARTEDLEPGTGNL